MECQSAKNQTSPRGSSSREKAQRRLGVERSVRKVTQRLNKSLTLIGKWSSRYNWPERARAYDRDLDRQAHAQAVRDVRSMTNRHIRIAMQLQAKALEALEQLNVATLSPKMQLAFLAKATEIERMNRLSAAGMDDSGQQRDGAEGIEVVIEGEDDVDDQS